VDWLTPLTENLMRLRLCVLIACFALIAIPRTALAEGIVNVLYAGSLVNLMERTLGPAFTRASGQQFRGYAGGSNKLANEIKGELRRGDIFISANPLVNNQLMGATNGDWVRWYIQFAESPVVIGYSASSRFAADFTNKPWYEVLLEPGIRIGRTDPKLDPKGAFTVELFQQAEKFYKQPGLSQRILGATENPTQVLPEEALVGRFQSGELDVAFFYSTEAADRKIAFVTPPAEIDPKARYTATILRDAPNQAGAEQFLVFLMGTEGRDLLREHGLDLLKPTLFGDAQTIPASVKLLVDKAP
jgi:molybdate/tungstate transport system substrate-binding protein